MFLGGGADIGGHLSCRGGQLTGHNDRDALYADGIRVHRNVLLDEGFTAAGAVRLIGARIGGQVSCSGAQLAGSADGVALVADGIRTGGDVDLDKGFTAAGVVSLVGADISGHLSCWGARLNGNADGVALVADGMKTGGVLSLGGGFIAAGAVRLTDAEITGQLSCSGAHLTGYDKNGTALRADGTKARSTVFLDDGFTAAGVVFLIGAEITGQLICSGAQLTGHDSNGRALRADGMKVSGSVMLDDGFTAAGAVLLPAVEITGQVSCRDAHLTGHDTDGYALRADGIKLGGDFFLDAGFTAAGSISLRSARIDGSLDLGGDLDVGQDGAR